MRRAGRPGEGDRSARDRARCGAAGPADAAGPAPRVTARAGKDGRSAQSRHFVSIRERSRLLAPGLPGPTTTRSTTAATIAACLVRFSDTHCCRSAEALPTSPDKASLRVSRAKRRSTSAIRSSTGFFAASHCRVSISRCPASDANSSSCSRSSASCCDRAAASSFAAARPAKASARAACPADKAPAQ